MKMKFAYYDDENKELIESLWVSSNGHNYRLDNIPFYVIGYALGDVVSGKLYNDELFVDSLVEASGNSTVQVIFFDEQIVQSTRNELRAKGCASELSNMPNYIAVNVPKEVNYDEIRKYLDEGVDKEMWDYREACLAHNY